MEVINVVSNPKIPLVIDLDGTLVLTDTLQESIALFLKKNPLLNIFLLLRWFLMGKAKFKELISKQVELEVETLPYNQYFLDFLKEESKKGRKLILCTGAHETIAKNVARYLNIFDEVFSTSSATNLSGENKLNCLTKRFGKEDFIYAGNSHDDIIIWRKAKEIIAVNASNTVLKKLRKIKKTFINFEKKKPSLLTWVKLFRIHQWSKNILIFFPLIAAQQYFNLENMLLLTLAFIIFGICASSTYLINDVFDIKNDRLHHNKRYRPFAAGNIPISFSLIALLILPCAILLASLISKNFMFLMMLYILITFCYSFYFKSIPIVDCLVLASLYTIRVVGGAIVLSSSLSFWLLAFSAMFFFSLSLLKRYAEISRLVELGKKSLFGRGYELEDMHLILNMGISSGYGSIIIMMLYLNSPEIIKLHNYNEFAWLTIPVLLFWMSYIWLQAHRNKIADDPVIFSMRDLKSILSGIAFFAFMLIGSQ